MKFRKNILLHRTLKVNYRNIAQKKAMVRNDKMNTIDGIQVAMANRKTFMKAYDRTSLEKN